MPRSSPTYSEEEARRAVASARSYADALRQLGMCSTGGGGRVLRKWVRIWGIPTDHFDADAARMVGLGKQRTSLEEMLVRDSNFSRVYLKARLFAEGMKLRRCELCGQGEMWRGHRMALILDHVNGISNDNRLENLRIVCPNCAATLETHCGRKNASPVLELECLRCHAPFVPKSSRQRYCSRACGQRWDRSGRPLHKLRRAERPPYERLVQEVKQLGYRAVGRRYGVSDNAIRKWVRSYERQRGGDPPPLTQAD